MIFQTELTTLDSEISQLQALLNSVQQRRNLYSQFQQQTDGYLKGLSELKDKLASSIGTDAIASLKSAVVSLFVDDGNDGSGNEPTEPTPPDSPDSDEADEPELLCLNGLTGDFLLSSDEPEEDNPVCPEGEHILESNAPLIGQVCHINPDLYWAMTSTPDGSSWDFATPICCLLEDCPASSLIGQFVGLCSLLEDKPVPFIELVSHPDNPNIAYQRKHNGEIVCTYFGFSTKRNAQSWKEFIEALAHQTELRQAKRMEGCKWEIKVKGMNMAQINRLAANCDFTKPHQPQPVQQTPAQEAGIEPPSDWGQNKREQKRSVVLEEGDICQVVEGQFKQQKGAVCTISRFSEKPIGLQLPNGTIRYFYRTELKLVSKGSGESQAQRQQLQSGQVLMGNRVVTSGNYIGVAQQVREANAQRGTFDKLAAIELVKAGLAPELAMAAVKGESDDASDF